MSVEEIPLSTLIDEGLLIEINRRILHPRGLALGVDRLDSTVVLYSSSDPEGWSYDYMPERVDSFREKFEAYDKRMSDRKGDRFAELGWLIQPREEILNGPKGEEG